MLLSGLPPAGGFGLPPNTLVIRRMNVDLPQPESAARPITMVAVTRTQRGRPYAAGLAAAVGRMDAVPLKDDVLWLTARVAIPPCL